jgi:hypothetical protein
VLKAIIIIVIVIGVLLGGLMTLRNSARTGVPGEDVLRRARQRELDLEEKEKNDTDAKDE